MLRKAIRQATEKLAEQMIEKAPSLPRRLSAPAPVRTTTPAPSAPDPAPPARVISKANTGGAAAKGASLTPRGGMVRGVVIDVSAGTVFVDRGSKAGLQAGDRLDVRRFVRSVTGSDGKTLKLDKKIGVIELTEVSEDWSSGKYSGEPAQKGDAAVRLQ